MSLDLRSTEHVFHATDVSPGDTIVYLGDARRRYSRSLHDLLRVTRVENGEIYGEHVHPKAAWEIGEEFVVVKGQIEHHGVYVTERGGAA